MTLVDSHTPGSAPITTLHWWGELCPEHGTAQGQDSAYAITAPVPVALQSWPLQRWHVRARLLGICLSSSAGNCGAGMCLKPLGGLVSPANISQLPNFSLSCALAFKSDKLNLWNYFI